MEGRRFGREKPASEGPLVGVCPCVLLEVAPGGEEPGAGGLPAVEGVAWWRQVMREELGATVTAVEPLVGRQPVEGREGGAAVRLAGAQEGLLLGVDPGEEQSGRWRSTGD